MTLCMHFSDNGNQLPQSALSCSRLRTVTITCTGVGNRICPIIRLYLHDFTPVTVNRFMYTTFFQGDFSVLHKLVVIAFSLMTSLSTRRVKRSARWRIGAYVSSKRLVVLEQHNETIYYTLVKLEMHHHFPRNMTAEFANSAKNVRCLETLLSPSRRSGRLQTLRGYARPQTLQRVPLSS